jgi:PAS domain S-box-containing protein
MKLSTEPFSDLVTGDGRLLLRTGILESLFNEVPDLAFFIKDSSGRYLSVNRSLIERHGCTHRGELIGRRPADICPGPFGQVPTKQDQSVLREGRPLVNQLELQWFRPNQPCWCLTTKLPLRDEEGTVIGLIGISKDLRDPVPLDEIPTEIALVLDQFCDQCAEPVSPSGLAERAGVPLSRLARVVKRVYGITPSQYITQTRIQASTRLLEETNLSVSEVALECGFCDHSAFSRAFRALIGLTPSQYREESKS